MKFSDGIRLMKCFCRAFSYDRQFSQYADTDCQFQDVLYFFDDSIHGRIGIFEMRAKQLKAVRR